MGKQAILLQAPSQQSKGSTNPALQKPVDILQYHSTKASEVILQLKPKVNQLANEQYVSLQCRFPTQKHGPTALIIFTSRPT